jgi:hypothetical protein
MPALLMLMTAVSVDPGGSNGMILAAPASCGYAHSATAAVQKNLLAYPEICNMRPSRPSLAILNNSAFSSRKERAECKIGKPAVGGALSAFEQTAVPLAVFFRQASAWRTGPDRNVGVDGPDGIDCARLRSLEILKQGSRPWGILRALA